MFSNPMLTLCSNRLSTKNSACYPDSVLMFFLGEVCVNVKRDVKREIISLHHHNAGFYILGVFKGTKKL